MSAGGERETMTLEVIPRPLGPLPAETGHGVQLCPAGARSAHSCPSREVPHQRDSRDFWGVQGEGPLRDHGP